ncbi:hypothetical protein Taro_048888 [Colocasia esculenta]|uniref:LOB domain-containing protein n=1 Tax=Colocasia esculenta TaxID=4460 RepID=A0A843X9A9_COLES|nr:hypothetical protein [Colocasia esculenta]
MSNSNNTHAKSVASSATSASSNHHHPSNTRRSSASGAGPGGGGGGKSSSGGGGASSGSTVTTTTTTTPTPACAACKYQRRKCNPDCTLAPYFPADHQRQFLNAHRLFGVSNIIKTLRGLDPSQRAAAMGSIIFQSDARARDPIGGCYRIILELQRQIDRDSAELDLVLRQLAICRAQAQQQQQPPLAAPALPAELNVASTINLIDQADNPSTDHGVVDIPTLQQEQQERERQEQQQQEQQYLYYYFGGGDDGGDEQPHGNNDNASEIAIKDVHGAGVEPPPDSPMLGQQYHRQHYVDDDDVVKPAPVEALFDVVRHHQAFLVAGEEDDSSKVDTSPDLDYRFDRFPASLSVHAYPG